MKSTTKPNESFSVSNDADAQDLWKLWFDGEQRMAQSSNELYHDISVEPMRDTISENQRTLALALIDTPAAGIEDVLNKLKIWEAACGPFDDIASGNTHDLYANLVISAIKDLSRLSE